MKKSLLVLSAGLLIAVSSCGNSKKENSTETITDSSTETVVPSDTLPVPAETKEVGKTDTTPEITAAPETPAAPPQEEQVVKSNPKIDKLIKTGNNFISDIKREGYMDGKPMDPAELQFSDVRTYIRDLRQNLSKLQSMESEMTPEQKKSYDDLRKKADRIFKDISF